MAVPTYIKGNILFYRGDILKRYNLAPPRTWDELRAICRKVLPQEKSLKYGLLIHSTNTLNDFYPILWGFGGRVNDDAGQFVLPQKNNADAFVAALKELVAMQGSIMPGPGALKQFDPAGSLRQAFYQGQTLFMINWNTRMKDLSDLIAKGQGQPREASPASARWEWPPFRPRPVIPTAIPTSALLAGPSTASP